MEREEYEQIKSKLFAKLRDGEKLNEQVNQQRQENQTFDDLKKSCEKANAYAKSVESNSIIIKAKKEG